MPLPPSPTILPSALACGGSRSGPECAGDRVLGDGPVKFSVRGSAYGEATLSGTGSIDATWFSSQLVGDVPGLGRVLFSSRPERPSTVSIQTLSSAWTSPLRSALFGASSLLGESASRWAFSGTSGRALKRVTQFLYMPAMANQEMYFQIGVYDAEGREVRVLRSEDPM